MRWCRPTRNDQPPPGHSVKPAESVAFATIFRRKNPLFFGTTRLTVAGKSPDLPLVCPQFIALNTLPAVCARSLGSGFTAN